MKEVAEEAKAKSEEANKKFFQGVRHLIRQQATNRKKDYDASCHKPVLIVIAGFLTFSWLFRIFVLFCHCNERRNDSISDLISNFGEYLFRRKVHSSIIRLI